MLERQGLRARCAVVVQSQTWVLHVLVDGRLLVAERTRRGAETFALAESFKQWLLADGWQLLVPRVDPPAPTPAS